jgi:hypothetical protein
MVFLTLAILLPVMHVTGQTNFTKVIITSPAKNADLIRGHTYMIKWSVGGAEGSIKSFSAKLLLTTPMGDNGFTNPYLNVTNTEPGTSSFV